MANDLFLVKSLDEITYQHFRMACVFCMDQDRELIGLLSVPCSDDYDLFRGKEEARVKVRNWSNMLELHVVSESGIWIVSSHIDGMDVDGVIDEAFAQFESAKPFIMTKAKKAFGDGRIADGAVHKWQEYYMNVFDEIKRYFDSKENVDS